MDYLLIYMENCHMHELTLTTNNMPVLMAGDFLVASEPFLHIDRQVDFHVLIYVTEGAIYVTEDEQDYTIHPGEVLFLKAGVHHYGKYMIEAGTAWYYAHFYLEQYTSSCAVNHIKSEIDQKDRYRKRDETNLGANMNQRDLSSENSETVMINIPKKLTGMMGRKPETALQKCIALFHSDSTYDRWMANAALFQFLSECAFEKEVEAEVTLGDRISSYLSEHIKENFSAEEISAYFYLSYKYLAAVFKKEKGKSMQQYHNNLRMQEACKLLRSTGLPIGEISVFLGFTDALYFSKCFHQTVGCSPKQYRRQLEY